MAMQYDTESGGASAAAKYGAPCCKSFVRFTAAH